MMARTLLKQRKKIASLDLALQARSLQHPLPVVGLCEPEPCMIGLTEADYRLRSLYKFVLEPSSWMITRLETHCNNAIYAKCSATASVVG